MHELQIYQPECLPECLQCLSSPRAFQLGNFLTTSLSGLQLLLNPLEPPPIGLLQTL